jgi:hypothetical protein
VAAVVLLAVVELMALRVVKGLGVLQMLLVMVRVAAVAAVEALMLWIELGDTAVAAPVPAARGPEPAVRFEPAALAVET